jgi:toxin ParE1/3/4
MSYLTTQAADEDIVEIYLHGKRSFGTIQAEHCQDGLFRTFALLASDPNLARLRDEFRPPVRLYPYGVHVIIFADHGDDVTIIRVLHGRQDWIGRLSH